MSPVVVVDDISPVVRTFYVDRIRYGGPSVVRIPKTQHSVLFVSCIGQVNRESQKSLGVYVIDIYEKNEMNTLINKRCQMVGSILKDMISLYVYIN